MDSMYALGYKEGIEAMRKGAAYDFLHSTVTEDYINLLKKRANKLVGIRCDDTN